MAPLFVAPVLSGQSHLLVHNNLAAEGVGTKANGDSNDDSYTLALVCMIPGTRWCCHTQWNQLGWDLSKSAETLGNGVGWRGETLV